MRTISHRWNLNRRSFHARIPSLASIGIRTSHLQISQQEWFTCTATFGWLRCSQKLYIHVCTWLEHIWKNKTVLTNSKEYSSASQISRLLRKLNFYYRVHISPPLVLILSQMNPVHIVTPYFSKVNGLKLGLSICLTKHHAMKTYCGVEM